MCVLSLSCASRADSGADSPAGRQFRLHLCARGREGSYSPTECSLPGCLRASPRRWAPPPATRAVPMGGPGPRVATSPPHPALSPGPPERPRARAPREAQARRRGGRRPEPAGPPGPAGNPERLGRGGLAGAAALRPGRLPAPLQGKVGLSRNAARVARRVAPAGTRTPGAVSPG